jgi:[ribosomal protein S5]-alanine N-acetyltransferase
VQLESDRVVLRDFCAEDVAAYQRYHADPQYLRYYAPKVADPEHARKLVQVFIDSAQAQPRRDFTLAIVERGVSQLVGCCSLRTAGQDDGYAEFGLELSPSSWGRGLAVEAAGALLEFGFDVLKLNEIRGQSVTENRRVEHLVAKLGFKKLRELRGAAWMATRGWTHTEWSLKKSAWVLSG